MIPAMILCAGFGTRMGSLTRDTPKAMLPIGGKPILEHTIVHLASLGITNIIINVHYLADQITSYFGSGESWGVQITYSHETTPMGTAGGAKQVAGLLSRSPEFLLLHGDVVCDENYVDLLEAQRSRPDSMGTIVVHERRRSNSVVEMNHEMCITRFIERPSRPVPDKRQNWVNSGLYCLHRSVLDLIPEHRSCDFPVDVFPQLVAQQRLYGYPLTGYRCAVDSRQRYEQVDADIKAKRLFTRTEPGT